MKLSLAVQVFLSQLTIALEFPDIQRMEVQMQTQVS